MMRQTKTMPSGLQCASKPQPVSAIAKYSRIDRDLDLAQRCARLISMIQEQRFDPYIKGCMKSECFSVSGVGAFFHGRPESWSDEVRALLENDMLQLCKDVEDHDVVRILPRQNAKVEQFMQWYLIAINRLPATT
jgi:hypothetical protein